MTRRLLKLSAGWRAKKVCWPEVRGAPTSPPRFRWLSVSAGIAASPRSSPTVVSAIFPEESIRSGRPPPSLQRSEPMGISTECIHAGQEPEPATGAVTIPIYQTSTFVQPKLGQHKGYEYARTKNPTRSALEANLAVLERGKNGHCFASGMAATDTVLRMLKSGDHVVAAEDMYGGTFRLFHHVLEKYGLEFTY